MLKKNKKIMSFPHNKYIIVNYLNSRLGAQGKRELLPPPPPTKKIEEYEIGGIGPPTKRPPKTILTVGVENLDQRKDEKQEKKNQGALKKGGKTPTDLNKKNHKNHQEKISSMEETITIPPTLTIKKTKLRPNNIEQNTTPTHPQ
ncbi:hypothetical protein GCM10023238_19230 [Streptomyces heliomycini]